MSAIPTRKVANFCTTRASCASLLGYVSPSHVARACVPNESVMAEACGAHLCCCCLGSSGEAPRHQNCCWYSGKLSTCTADRIHVFTNLMPVFVHALPVNLSGCVILDGVHLYPPGTGRAHLFLYRSMQLPYCPIQVELQRGIR